MTLPAHLPLSRQSALESNAASATLQQDVDHAISQVLMMTRGHDMRQFVREVRRRLKCWALAPATGSTALAHNRLAEIRREIKRMEKTLELAGFIRFGTDNLWRLVDELENALPKQ